MSKIVGVVMMLVFQACVSVAAAVAVADKVSLELYYESLCPYCSSFITQGLPSIFSNGIIDIVDLKLYPWGNAKIRPDSSSFDCQHGPLECLLNTVEACAIHAYPALRDHFPMIECVERLGSDTHWESCFNNSDSIRECSSGDLGKQLELKYAAATDALNPPHEYVPWVVVNGQPLYEDIDNFTSYICKAYKGTPPTACTYLKEKTTLDVNSLCYVDKPTRSRMPQTYTGFM